MTDAGIFRAQTEIGATATAPTMTTTRGQPASVIALPRWRYRAVDPATGSTREAVMEAVDLAAVRAAVRATGWELDAATPLDRPRVANSGIVLPAFLTAWWRTRQRAARQRILIEWCESLATLLQVGMTMDRALEHLATAPGLTRVQRQTLQDLALRVRRGTSVADATAAHPGWFDATDIALLAAGQRAGAMAAALTDIAAWHERAQQHGHRLMLACLYPCLLLIAALGVVAFISHATLPQLLAMLRDAGIAEPALSRTVMHLGQWLVAYGWLAAPLGLAGTLIAAATWGRLPDAHPLRRWWRSTPWTRAWLRQRVAQTAATLARLFRAGVPLADALVVTARSARDRGLAAALEASATAVRRGERFSDAIARSGLFDATVAQLLRMGEDAGELGTVLPRLAERMQAHGQRSSARFAALLEPAAVIAVAALIGTVVMAAVLPLVALGQLV